MDNSAGLDVSVNNEDPFAEGLKSLECESILINCMQNLEKQVLEIFKMLKKTEIVKLKRMSCQLIDLAKGVGFTNLKVDEYEKDQCEKDAIFGTLQND